MIEVSRIVKGFAHDLPALFEAPIVGPNYVVTLWMTAEPMTDWRNYEFVRVTEIESGESIDLDIYDSVTWLQPEDADSPALQAELITALAAKGIEL
jgi:hypothetical protein